MIYRLKIGSAVHSLDVWPLDEARCMTVAINDVSRTIAVRAVDGNHVHARVDGRAVNLFVASTPGGTWVWAEGRPRLVEDADKAERRKSRGPLDQPAAVTPPTPATVMRIMVEVGQVVERGQACVVVSAMKMELTLAAPYAGMVTAVQTEAGAKVMPGEILVDIEPLPEAQLDE